jgi:protein-disulfide isomerase
MTVVIFEDLQCSDCAALQRMLDDTLLKRYGSQVEFAHRDFPLEKHSWARKAAIAARYFSGLDAGLGLAYRRHALADPAAVDFNARLTEFLRANALAAPPLDDARLAAAVDEDVRAGLAKRVTRTPTLFVNGKAFVEKFNVEEISEAIDNALAAE